MSGQIITSQIKGAGAGAGAGAERRRAMGGIPVTRENPAALFWFTQELQVWHYVFVKRAWEGAI
jgi:hypothetical protein